MPKESPKIADIESLIQELSDEELASCSGGLFDIHILGDAVDLTLRVDVGDATVDTTQSVRCRI